MTESLQPRNSSLKNCLPAKVKTYPFNSSRSGTNRRLVCRLPQSRAPVGSPYPLGGEGSGERAILRFPCRFVESRDSAVSDAHCDHKRGGLFPLPYLPKVFYGQYVSTCVQCAGFQPIIADRKDFFDEYSHTNH